MERVNGAACSRAKKGTAEMLRGRWAPVWVLVTTLLVVLSAAGCVMQINFINVQQARDIAVRSSISGHLRATEPPSILQAELMPLGVAEKRLAQNGDSGRTQAPTRMAWLVTLEGTWTLGTVQKQLPIFSQTV